MIDDPLFVVVAIAALVGVVVIVVAEQHKKDRGR